MRAGLGPELGDDKWAMDVREKKTERREKRRGGLLGRAVRVRMGVAAGR
jgi:hypothetical protein